MKTATTPVGEESDRQNLIFLANIKQHIHANVQKNPAIFGGRNVGGPEIIFLVQVQRPRLRVLEWAV